MRNNRNADEARHPRRGARPTIGLLSEVAGSSYHDEIWAGFVSVASELDVNLICYVGGTIGASEYGFDPQRNILYDVVTDERVDGLIISGTIGNYITADEFRSFVNRYRSMPMIGIAQPPGIPSVVVDNEKGMRDIVTHFIEVHGCRRIAFIRGPADNEEAALRYRAYADALAKHNVSLDPDLVAPGNFVYESGVDAIRLFLDERKVEFDAVVASSDWMAFGALQTLENRGIRVPDDVAVGGFDDTREATASHPSLTTVRQPIRDLGRASIEMLLKLLAGERVPEQTMLPAELVVRQSCGCSEPVIMHAAVGPLERKKEPLGEAIVAQREAILSEMVQVIQMPVSLSSEWTDRLLDAFVEEMVSDSAPQGSFLSVLDDVLRQAVEADSQVDDWQEALSVMRRHILPYLTDAATLSRAEDLFNQGRVVVGKVAQWYWVRQGVDETRLTDAQSYFSGDLVAVVEMEQILDVIGFRLPELGFETFYLSFYDGQERPAEWSRLLLAYERGKRVEVDAGGRRFLTRQLTPEELLPQERRYTWVVLSLNFRENQFGCLVLETESREARVYGTMIRQVNSALHDSLLVQRLENRSLQLMAAAEVSRATSSILDLDELIQQVVSLVQERFDLYYAGLFLVEDEWVVLRAGTGEAGERMLAESYKLKIDADSLVGRCVMERRACIASGVGQGAGRLEDSLLPEARSEMALPLLSLGDIIGVLTVHRSQETAFGDEDIVVFQTMADQLANAITNAWLYEQSQVAYAEVEKQVRERTVELERETAERERLQQEVIEAQKQALQELSTPIIPIMERIIVMPLIGSIDSMRARDITRALLAGIRQHRARVVILDITGVSIVDSGVAGHLNKTIQAARLKGTRAIITGVSDAVAETIVDLGIDWSGVKTLSDLQSGLLAALSEVGLRITG